jgi:hypothetical protein
VQLQGQKAACVFSYFILMDSVQVPSIVSSNVCERTLFLS